MMFKDHFSGHADDYARYRPDYPGALFEFLASVVKQHERAWDCGTGNGQAAPGLAVYFDRVIATDPSENQIQNTPCRMKKSAMSLPRQRQRKSLLVPWI